MFIAATFAKMCSPHAIEKGVVVSEITGTVHVRVGVDNLLQSVKSSLKVVPSL
jgi:hypothetical protein